MSDKKADKADRCDCGTVLTAEDRDFWGECKNCRAELPISFAQLGDTPGNSQGDTDRHYHGGLGFRGEW